jgi:Peptidase C13 family
MTKFWFILKTALRAAIWKSTPQACAVGVPTLLGWSLAAMAAGIAYEYGLAGAAARFNPYGLNSAIAQTAVSLVVASLFVSPQLRATFLSAMLAFALLVWAVQFLAVRASTHWPFALPNDLQWPYRYLLAAVFVVELIWWIGALYAIMRSIIPAGRGRPLLRAVALWPALLVASVALPYYPTFRGPDYDRLRVNLWEYIPALLNGTLDADKKPPPRRVDREQVELAQPALLENQIAALAPHASGRTNLYAIGMAGWSEQNVFVKELDGGLKSLSAVLPLDGHVIRLVNNVDTADNTPIASLQNFAASVHAVAQAMDRERDVLLLFMTSHGSRNGVGLLLTGELYADLSPRDVAMILDSEGIANRIVIVSACYSGVFLKALANENSIVLTAADTDHPSFGCSDERGWTYFGDAFFNRSLTPGENLQQAFIDAKKTVGEWEADYGLTPSNPQGFFGRALTNKLVPLYLHPTSPTPMQSAAGR